MAAKAAVAVAAVKAAGEPAAAKSMPIGEAPTKKAKTDPLLDELLETCHVSSSKTRLEITASCKLKPRLCVLSMKMQPHHKDPKPFIEKVKKMVDNGHATKKNINELKTKFFA
eukprot:TRINITY_DN44805_c0_g1_i3.p3 TRINITY_DN44805_c0_g1~~TRINITY_DN44805_c0_g1_i3.p3  ORF type:complete len:113 (+),score=48.39 TRINITY_DN44805_c0_g1_i3:423-761(+)